jgi:hypothetical protein
MTPTGGAPQPDAIGPYSILGEIGRGGMGVVYRARDARLSRDVAVKMLHRAADADANRLRRFLDEARAAAALNHPNILAVHDVAIEADTPYIVSELVEGASLRQDIDRGPLKLSRLLDLATQIADGLVAAHAAGVVHRDLKPENVMITRDGRVKIVDFGLAKSIEPEPDGRDAETLTAPHSIVGTPAYMSPEQARGGPIDFRSDLFSFGAMVYEMACRERAFERQTSIDTLSAILHEEPRPLTELNDRCPLELQRVVERCLAKAPEDRYAATADLFHDLRWLAQRSTSGTGMTRPLRASFRRRLLALAGAAALAIATSAGGWVVAMRWSIVPAPAGLATWQRLTFNTGFVHGARFAADGQTVLYSASWNGEPMQVFSTTLASPESRALELPPAGLLAISRTGQLALSRSCRYVTSPGTCAGTLARAPLLGGAPRDLVDNVRSADWGPDDQLAAVFTAEGQGRVEYPLGVRLSDRGGGHVRVSPDGQRVAWTEATSRNADTIVVSDQRGTRVLSTGWTFLSGIAWASDSKALFVSGVGHGALGDTVHRIPLDGVPRPVLRSMPRIRVLDAGADDRLLLDRSSERTTMLLRTLPASESRDLTWLGNSVLDALSADGRVALFSIRAANAVGWNVPLFPIYFRQTSGGHPTQIGSGYGVALSGDGRWALSRSGPDRPEASLTLVPLGPGEPRTFDVTGHDLTAPAWTADITSTGEIIFAARQGSSPWRTYVQRSDNRPPTALTHEPGHIVSPLSPDGHRFISRRADGSHWLATLTPAESTRLPVTLGVDQEIAQWTEGGRQVFVTTIVDDRISVHLMDLVTGRLTLVTEVTPSPLARFRRFAYDKGLAISRDGRTIAYSESTTTSELFLVEGVR